MIVLVILFLERILVEVYGTIIMRCLLMGRYVVRMILMALAEE